jgi:hypothetical protein
VTSAANPHYQKHFDRLFDLAKAGDWRGSPMAARSNTPPRSTSGPTRC